MEVDDRKGFTFFERIMLQHASPLKLACDGAPDQDTAQERAAQKTAHPQRKLALVDQTSA